MNFFFGAFACVFVFFPLRKEERELGAHYGEWKSRRAEQRVERGNEPIQCLGEMIWVNPRGCELRPIGRHTYNGESRDDLKQSPDGLKQKYSGPEIACSNGTKSTFERVNQSHVAI